MVFLLLRHVDHKTYTKRITEDKGAKIGNAEIVMKDMEQCSPYCSQQKVYSMFLTFSSDFICLKKVWDSCDTVEYITASRP